MLVYLRIDLSLHRVISLMGNSVTLIQLSNVNLIAGDGISTVYIKVEVSRYRRRRRRRINLPIIAEAISTRLRGTILGQTIM